MENFIYSINVTMPIFLVMVIGYILKQIGMLNDNFVTVANKFNFKVTLPFMLFKDIAGVDIKAVFDIKYVLFCAIVSTICFWVVWGTAKLLVRDKTIRGAFVQSSFRGSAASMIKLVLQPLVFLPVAAWMGFSGEKMIAILIMLASPTTPSCYIMAKSMNNDEVLTASVIVTTTLMAAFTLTGWIFLLKTLGYIG